MAPAGARASLLLQNQITHPSSVRSVASAPLRHSLNDKSTIASHKYQAASTSNRIVCGLFDRKVSSPTRRPQATASGEGSFYPQIPKSTGGNNLDKILNLSVLGAVGVVGFSLLLSADSDPWTLYQNAVASDPLQTKASISGIVYSVGDLIAQTYEGRDISEWDRGRVVRSGLCGLLAHGPLSHLYYLGLDHVFSHQELFASGSWMIPLTKVAIDQTVWSVFWNSSYYVLLGLLKFESPSLIAKTVKNSWWDLLKAGWRLWPMVHIVTYGVIPVQHRLLFVDAVELVWVSILSLYGQQQRVKAMENDNGLAAVACALPGNDGKGGSSVEEIYRSIIAEHEIVLQDASGGEQHLTPAEVYISNE